MSNDSPTINPSVPIAPQALPQGALAVFNPTADGAQLQTRMSMELTTSSMVSIAVSNAERQIRAAISGRQKELKLLEAGLDKLDTELNTYVKNFTEKQATTDSRLPILTAALAVFGINATPVYALATYNERTGKMSGTFSFEDRGTDKSSASFQFTYQNVPDASYVEGLAQRTALVKSIELKKREILSGRSALNNVDSLERQAEASIATRLAQNSGEVGKAIVEGLNGLVNVDGLIDELSI